MFPISDSVKSRKFPLFTIIIIAVNVFIFACMLLGDTESIVTNYALTPTLINFKDPQTLIPFISSQFLHGGFFHIFSNMWFLWIFADNIEERLGKIRFLILYILSGIVGAFLQYIISFDSAIPMLGASGAVSGILGAYFVLFPRHKIRSVVFLLFAITTLNIPASFYILYWFIVQLFSGFASLPSISPQTGGVAFFAHVGGFAFGYFITKYLFAREKKSWIEGIIID